MRLAGQAKGGYYAAHPTAVAKALKFLVPPKSGSFSILDPCCGEAEALAQLAAGLNCPLDRTYGIELEDERAIVAKQRLPESPILGPASFFGTSLSARSMSFIWLNPPFDTEIDGGRVETKFLQTATYKLVDEGVIALVCPESVADNWEVQRWLLSQFDDLGITEFPADHRPYNEVIVFGTRRKEVRSIDTWNVNRQWDKDCEKIEPGRWTYELPHCLHPPARFAKTELTPREESALIDNSPLTKLLAETHEPKLARPPLPLGKGHRALLLTAGHLDGVVRPHGEPPHVVRGTAKKITYVSNVERVEGDEESESEGKTVVTYSQKITLVVRTIEPDGTITTFSQDENLKVVDDDLQEQPEDEERKPDTSRRSRAKAHA